MTPQALIDTRDFLIDLTLLVSLAFFGMTSYDSLSLRERFAAERTKLQTALYYAKDELRFTHTFMINCLNGKTQVVGRTVGVLCIPL